MNTLNTLDFSHIEIYENQDERGSLVAFEYNGLGFNFLNIDIEIIVRTTVDVKEINGRQIYLPETEYNVKVNEMDFITSRSEIFDGVDGFTEKDYTLSEEETKVLIEAIKNEITNDIESYIDND